MAMKFDADHKGDRNRGQGRDDACSVVKSMLPLYSGGDLTLSESREVTQHLKLCTDCQEEAASYQSCLGVLSGMGSDHQSNPVSPFFWQGIQKEILIQQEKTRKRPWFRMRTLYVAAAAVLVTLTVYFVATYLLRTETVAQNDQKDIVEGIQIELPLPVNGIPVFVDENDVAPAGKPESKKTIEF